MRKDTDVFLQTHDLNFGYFFMLQTLNPSILTSLKKCWTMRIKLLTIIYARKQVK